MTTAKAAQFALEDEPKLTSGSGNSNAEVVSEDHQPGGQDSSDKGLQPSMAGAPFSSEQTFRTAFYVDGFNLYHAIVALDEPRLKWLDLHSLAASYLREGQIFHRVAFFTAYNTWAPEKRKRHLNYVKALSSRSVEVYPARFETSTKFCRKHDRYCRFHEEKQSDVALATLAVSDAYEGWVDNYFFVTSDSDQIPVLKQIRARFPEKRVFLLAPPKSLSVARELGRHADAVFELTAGRLRAHELPANVVDAQGRKVAHRPAAYEPHHKHRT